MTFPVIATIAAEGEAAATVTHTIALTGASSNDLLMVIGQFEVSGGASVTPPAGWTESLENVSKLYVAAKIAGSSEPATVDFTASSAIRSALFYLRITGASRSILPTISNTNIGASTTTYDPPNHTPSPAGARDFLWIAMAGIRDDIAISAYPTNCPDNRTANVVPTEGAVAIATANNNAASFNPDVFTLASSAIGGVATIAVFPVSASLVAPMPAYRHLITR